ncbi:MAG: hypothetical protein IBJ11_04990 [Phycisphaerales bacterium]|nr:hypothetical protein [Phycisphaerales bacterium]
MLIIYGLQIGWRMGRRLPFNLPWSAGECTLILHDNHILARDDYHDMLVESLMGAEFEELEIPQNNIYVSENDIAAHLSESIARLPRCDRKIILEGCPRSALEKDYTTYQNNIIGRFPVRLFERNDAYESASYIGDYAGDISWIPELAKGLGGHGDVALVIVRADGSLRSMDDFKNRDLSFIEAIAVPVCERNACAVWCRNPPPER